MRSSMNTFSLAVIATIAVFTALYFAKALLAPVVAAFVLGIVMTPLSELMDKLRIPLAVGAFLSVLLAIFAILAIIFLLEPYVSQVLAKAPIIQAELRETLLELRRLLSGLQRISNDMAAAIEPDQAGAAEVDEPMGLPSLTDALFYAPQFLGQFLIFAGTLYFFVMARNSVYDWLSSNFTALAKRDLRNAAKQVSRYVLTISTINFGFGVCVAVVMHLIGMPSPVVWGLLAFLLNYLLYLGPATLAVILLITGIVVFDGAASFLPPAIYIAMNATEAQFVTPTLVGKSLSVNPLMVFLAFVFGLGLWGPIGGIIAMPLLTWTLTVFKSVNTQAISGGTPGSALASSSAFAGE